MTEEFDTPEGSDGIEMPRPTAGPMILSAGILLLGAGVALGISMSIVGVIIMIAGLAVWIRDLMPGRGHMLEERSPPEQRPRPIAAVPGTVEQMHAGLPGYRMRLPLHVHPISAGIRGGFVGGLLMPIPALIWGLLSGHGIWYPVNLLAGMVAAGLGNLPVAELEKFNSALLMVGLVLHAIMSLVFGLLYGVLLPTLPASRGGQILWGGLVLPLLWTGASYGLMGVVNPLLQQRVAWHWFVASQLVFGIAAALVVIRSEMIAVPPAGMGPDTESLTR
jgi:uncharacterized membrane protein YagU involved in acid resistance